MKKFIFKAFKILLFFAVIGAIALFAVYTYIRSTLQSVNSLTDVTLSEPLRVYDQNGTLLAEFGEKRRIFVPFDKIPKAMKDAVVAIEDRRFYTHSGIDPRSMARAAYSLLSTGKISQGASTLTQQVARNFYLSNEKTFTRKAKEIILAMEIEKELTKDQILELYLNNSFLGNRAYGVASAAKIYFNKTLDQLTLSEIATIAGLNQSPSYTNPIRSIARTTVRRDNVLKAMFTNGYITREQYLSALDEHIIVDRGPLVARVGGYVSEIVRSEMVKKYGEDVYNSGYKVYTTVDYSLQQQAEKSLRKQLVDYDRRHGWHGPTAQLWKEGEAALSKDQVIKKLTSFYDFGVIFPIGILQTNDSTAYAVDTQGKEYKLGIESVKWARKFIDDNSRGPVPTKVSQVLTAGDVVYLEEQTLKGVTNYKVAAIPQVNSGFVSLDSNDGAVKSLVGGFSFQLSPFNRVLQSVVQIGSSIKPFVYAAALDKGVTLGSIINDAPITLKVNNDLWQPRNYGDKFEGYMTVRQGLAQSKNSIVVRLAREVGINYIGDYLQRFGFNPKDYQVTESLVLGTPSFTPITMAKAYATWDNGGFLIQPYIVNYITDANNTIIYRATPEVACPDCFDAKNKYLDQIASLKDEKSDVEKSKEDTSSYFNLGQLGVFYDKYDESKASSEYSTMDKQEATTTKQAPRVVDPNIAWLINNALSSNIFGGPGYYGTGGAAMRLGRKDIGGKTGTTNSNKSTWFAGYGSGQTAISYVAFDVNNRELGKTETGSALPLKIWIEYMKAHLADTPITMLPQPPGIISAMINVKTGLLTDGGEFSYKEYFVNGTEPLQKQDILDSDIPTIEDVFK